MAEGRSVAVWKFKASGPRKIANNKKSKFLKGSKTELSLTFVCYDISGYVMDSPLEKRRAVSNLLKAFDCRIYTLLKIFSKTSNCSHQFSKLKRHAVRLFNFYSQNTIIYKCKHVLRKTHHIPW